ncbi:ABC transporter permease subunit, partial [Serratia symbiotica]|uniref:ABC transporter permease subunit n=1 Tax=Serratia symbiotica TaxID=138074 RepID=UPI000AF00861
AKAHCIIAFTFQCDTRFYHLYTKAAEIDVDHSPAFLKIAKDRGLAPSVCFASDIERYNFVGIITGSMVIETIYGLPGIGQLFVNGALNRDYSLVLSLTILVGGLTILFNAIVDMLYAVIDPKIRY